MPPEGFKFHFPMRVRYAETDAQGFAFNGVYFTYMDTATYEYFRNLGFTYRDLVQLDCDYSFVEINCKFIAPAYFDELLHVYVRFLELRNSSFRCAYEIRAAESDRLIFQGQGVCVGLDEATKRPHRLDDEVRRRILEFEGDPSINRPTEKQRA